MIFQLLQSMFSTMAGAWRGPTVDVRAAIHEAQDDSINSAPPIVGDEPYAGDIRNLEVALFEGRPLESGTSIDITLQNLLQICPRNRRRIDAYRGLVRELASRDISLTITSNKTRHYDSKS